MGFVLLATAVFSWAKKNRIYVCIFRVNRRGFVFRTQLEYKGKYAQYQREFTFKIALSLFV